MSKSKQPARHTSLPVSATGNFSPHQPWPKQQQFLELTCLEAFYGGAAGGGKSDALLLAALKYVHIPNYAALILRKDTQRLKLAGGLIPRAHSWLTQRGATWNGSERCWTFPTSGAPATIRFGYLLDADDKYRYGSSEFQYIAFDELTEFPEEDYLFLFSRLRRTTDVTVPLRMRSASNPGGMGHAWVKTRFIGDEAVHWEGEAPADPSTGVKARFIGDKAVHAEPATLWRDGRAYIPATIDDNPSLDADSYRQSLRHLPPLFRERLMNGDWSLREDGLIRPDWLRYYDEGEDCFTLLAADGEVLAKVASADCRRFVTIDPAGTSADRARERRGRPASWTAIQVWEQTRTGRFDALLLREAWRGRVGFDALCAKIRHVHLRWWPQRMWIENEKLGQAAVDVLGRSLPLTVIATEGRDKVARAAWLITRLERGEVFLPQSPTPWRMELEAELLGWTGDPAETSDQVDAAAYAAVIAERQQGPKLVIGAVRSEGVIQVCA